MKPFDWIPSVLHGRAIDIEGVVVPTAEVVVRIAPTLCANCGSETTRGLVWCKGTQMIRAQWSTTFGMCVEGPGVRASCGDCEPKEPAKPEDRFRHLDVDWEK